ncbi:MAG: hypothetical protein M3417_08575 [Actinomycetota bacterium]|nr:hypothetical protein [Actinomycetota bacterium]
MPRRCAALVLALASLGISACGGEESAGEEVLAESKVAETEAHYLDLNGLKYQVQLSRQLNPRDVEDADYFNGFTPEQSALPDGSIWFGVFIRVENDSEEAIPSARSFTVEDTQGNEFEPVESENVFAFRPETVPGGGYIPNQERLQAYAGSQGSLLLYKVPLASLENRPLELTIKSPNDSRMTAGVDLDV